MLLSAQVSQIIHEVKKYKISWCKVVIIIEQRDMPLFIHMFMWQIYFQSNLNLISAGSSIQGLIQCIIVCMMNEIYPVPAFTLEDSECSTCLPQSSLSGLRDKILVNHIAKLTKIAVVEMEALFPMAFV